MEELYDELRFVEVSKQRNEVQNLIELQLGSKVWF